MTATALFMWVLSRFSALFLLPSLLHWSLPALLAVLSTGLAIAGVFSFRRFATTIDPTRPGSASTLITGGIFRFTRNPMYLGFAGVLLAWGLHLQAWWSLPLPVLFCLYITVFQILPEEDALRSRFGERYLTYAASVRRWL
jgi:protein-S-isoprenylcysteine O-methyltransferase Ste14